MVIIILHNFTERRRVMLRFMDSMYFKAKAMMSSFARNERGDVNVVAIVVLIAVAVILAVLLKGQLSTLIETLVEGITKKAKTDLGLE